MARPVQWIWSQSPMMAGVRVKDGQFLWFSQDGCLPGGRVLQSAADLLTEGPRHPKVPAQVLSEVEAHARTLAPDAGPRRETLATDGTAFAKWLSADTSWEAVQEVVQAGLPLEPEEDAVWPLGLAVDLGNLEVVRGLLSLGADTESDHRSSAHPTTLLHRALAAPEILACLLEQQRGDPHRGPLRPEFDPNATDWSDCTALDRAIRDGAPLQSAGLLLAAGTDLNRCPSADFLDEPGPPAWSLAWQALHYGRKDIGGMMTLLLEGGSSLDQVGFDGSTLRDLLQRLGRDR